MSIEAVSLRGSLAAIYQVLEHQHLDEHTGEQDEYAEAFLIALVRMADMGKVVESRMEGDTLVLGLVSEKGQFPPDW